MYQKRRIRNKFRHGHFSHARRFRTRHSTFRIKQMKKNCLILFCVVFLFGCSSLFKNKETPFYEKTYALPIEAREWASKAPLKDLCLATKNWIHQHIREAALNEIKARDIDTRECYYTGMELTP